MLTQLVALTAEILDLILNFFNGAVNCNALFRESLQFIELLTELLLYGIASLLTVYHITALLDHLSFLFVDFRFKDFYLLVDLSDFHVIRNVIGLRQYFLWFLWNDSLLGNVDLREALASAPFAKHELAVFAVELGFSCGEWLVLLWQRFEVLLLFLSFFLLTLFFQLLALLSCQGGVIGSLSLFGFLLVLLLSSLIVCSFFLGIFSFLISRLFRTIDLFFSGCRLWLLAILWLFSFCPVLLFFRFFLLVGSFGLLFGAWTFLFLVSLVTRGAIGRFFWGFHAVKK